MSASFTFRLSDDQIAQLEAICARERRSRAYVVRTAIERYLAEEEINGKARSPRKSKKTKSQERRPRLEDFSDNPPENEAA